MGVGWFLQMCAYVKTPEKLDVLGVSRDPESSLFQGVRGVLSHARLRHHVATRR